MKLPGGKRSVLLLAAFMLCGCDAAVLVGGKTVGFSSGSFVTTSGAVTRVYPHPYEQVESACENALRELQASQMEKYVSIAETTLKADLRGDKVKIDVTYVSKDQTQVAILVGMAGTNATSELIHERIAGYFRNP
jgi:hypothetical protein